METDKKITEDNNASPPAETTKRPKLSKARRGAAEQVPLAKSKKLRVVDWQKIVVVIAVVAVLGFIASYSAMTGDASLCITTAPAEKIQQTTTEKEPYTVYKEVDQPYNYIITYELAGANFYDWLYRKFGKVEIKNTDEHSGIFTAIGKFTLVGKEEKQILSYDIPPEKTKLFYFEYFDRYKDTDNASFTYEVIAPTKKVQKTVTEYREVEKTKEIKTQPQLSCLF